MHYLDTSVLVAFYVPEPMSASAQKLCAGSAAAAISAITEVEFHSAVSRRVRTKELSIGDAQKVISHFRIHLDEHLYRVVPVAQGDYVLARDWLATFQTSLRSLDALHLAVTFANGLTLVTADKELARSARHFGVKCRMIS